MKAFIISLSKIEQSIKSAIAMINPLQAMGFDVELFEGTYGPDAIHLVTHENRKLHPTDHFENPIVNTIRLSGPGAIGCFYSHFRLWKKCVELNEPIYIFEDDVNFIRSYVPVQFNEVLILVLGSWTDIYSQDPNSVLADTPQALPFLGVCIPGTPGYAITPVAALKLLNAFSTTYTASDAAIRQSIVNIQIYSHLIGVANTDKLSLTATSQYWDQCKGAL